MASKSGYSRWLRLLKAKGDEDGSNCSISRSKVKASRPGIDKIVAHGLCSGCGACVYMAPALLEMKDELRSGRRPAFRKVYAEEGVEEALAEAAKVCPGSQLEHESSVFSGSLAEFGPAWGPVLAVYEGYACDDEIRFAGASGGASTALALFCIERAGAYGVLHTRASVTKPYVNETVMSRTRSSLLEATGSRYSPASPCERLGEIENAPGPCVFIGKPCDVAGTRKAQRLRRELDIQVMLAIAFFCAGTPSTQGTLDMLRRMGVGAPTEVKSLRYRGNGWPGNARATVMGERGEKALELTYQESWGEILSRHVQWRCKVCVDHTGEFADIAVGDPWHTPVDLADVGRSLIVARTLRGREFIEAAAAAGYLKITEVDPNVLPAAQPNLLKTRGAIWGRILVSRLMGVAYPKYKNMPTFRHWWSELTLIEKAKSILGTARRLMKSGRWLEQYR